MSESIDTNRRSLEMHQLHRGKIEVRSKVALIDQDDLSLAYTPGVAAVCEAIHERPSQAKELTVIGNSIAVVTDGSAVLGLGDIGPQAAMPVMEGKALLFRELAGIDAWPICLDAREPEALIAAVRALAPGFAGIFRGALDARAPRITDTMKHAAAEAIADSIPHPRPENILPGALDSSVTRNVARAVATAAP